MRARISGSLVIGLVLAVAGCGGGQWSSSFSSPSTTVASGIATGPTSTLPLVSGWVVYTDPSGITLQHPAEWTTQPGQLGPLIIYIDSGPDDGGFRRNVNVIVQQVTPGSTLDDYLQLSLGQVSDLGGTVEDSRAATLGGREGHSLTWHLTKSGRSLRFLSVWTLRDDHAYLVTYSADAQNFDAKLPDVGRLLTSLQLPAA